MSSTLSLILAILSTGLLGILVYVANKYGENLFDMLMDIFVIIYLYVLVPICFITIFYLIFISI